MSSYSDFPVSTSEQTITRMHNGASRFEIGRSAN